MDSLIGTLIAFIGALAILISVHEFGHFWVARKLGVKVLKFSIGFGKPLWTKKGIVDNTEFVIAAIPLGGYVKMLDEREEPVHEDELHRAFNRQSLKVRSAIVIAGPLFNFIFAIAAFWLIFFVGESGMRPMVGEIINNSPAAEAGLIVGDEIVSVGERKTSTWENTVYAFLASSIESDSISVTVNNDDYGQRDILVNLESINTDDTDNFLLDQIGLKPFLPKLPAAIGRVLIGEPADLAGLREGDKITKVNDQLISSWSEFVIVIRDNPEISLDISFERNGFVSETKLKPVSLKNNGQNIGRIGAAASVPEGFVEQYQAKTNYGPLESLDLAANKTWDFSILTLKVLGKIITGDASINNLSGPITIAQTAGRSANIGFLYFVKFLAIVSISLGVLNLLPIPVLDGGHLFFYILEAIKGSELSESFMEVGQKIGMVLLLMLMSVAFYVDISRLFS